MYMQALDCQRLHEQSTINVNTPYRRCRAHLKKRGILSRIARRGVESSEKLGKHRWVVERTHGWFAGFGKLRIRFERRLDIHRALLKLAAAIICSRFVDRWC